jgi:hypothetical protein
VDERDGGRELIACLEYRREAAGAAGVGVAGGGAAGGGAAGAPSEAELAGRLQAELGLRVRVRLLPAGTVPRSEVGKAVRVARWRAGDPPVPGLS